MLGTKKIWAPWRLAYVKEKKTGNCPFCTIPKEKPGANNLLLFQDRDIFIVLNKFPYNPYHLLVIPISHVKDPSQLKPATWTKLSIAIQQSLKILGKHTKAQGYNIGMNLGSAGGAGIPGHLHWHIVPRWNGDTNFMPLIGETKAIPVHNQSVYEELAPLFKGLGRKLSPR